jgi:thymidylate synthase
VAANHLRLIDGQSGYRELLRYVLTNGEVRSPRGLKTFDVGYTTIEFITPYGMLPLGVGRQLSRRVAAAEAVQLIGAFADPQLLLQASPNFARYIEPSGFFWGAYGRRIGSQLPHVVRKLTEDPDTRQAIITLWDPNADNLPNHKDYPCTLALGFSIIRDRVELDVTMRSNDVWRGLPYDVFQFTQLQHTVANVLDRSIGAYRHHTYSLHLYAEDDEAASDVAYSEAEVVTGFQPTGFGNRTGEEIYGAMIRARGVALGFAPDTDHDRLELDESERWYWDALHPAK